MRKLILILLCGFSFIGFSQKKKRKINKLQVKEKPSIAHKNDVQLELQIDFDKIAKVGYENTKVFKVDNKVGFVNTLNLVELIAPKFTSYRTLMYSNLYFFFKDKSVSYDVEANKLICTELGTDLQPIYPDGYEIVEPIRDIEMLSSEKGYFGFEVNDKGDVIKCSDLYKNYFPSVIKAFKYNDLFYAIVENQSSKKGIITQDGKTVEHFNFDADNITINQEAEDSNLWFYVENKNNFSFISFDGMFKMKNEKLVSTDLMNEDFGLKIVTKKTNESEFVSGIIDFTKMEWFSKPQSTVVYLSFDYVKNGNYKTFRDKKIGYEIIKYNRTESNWNILVQEKNCTYVIDKDLKTKYIPAKYLK